VEVASDIPAVRDCPPRRCHRRALGWLAELDVEGAAGSEQAAGPRLEIDRDRAWWAEAKYFGAGPGHAFDQLQRAWAARGGEHCPVRPVFDEPARVDDGDLVG